MSARRIAPALLALALGSGASDVPALAQPGPAGLTDVRIETSALDPLAAVERFGGGDPVWIGWSVEPVEEVGHVCCGWSRGGRPHGCSLADEDRGWTSSDDEPPGGGGRLHLLARAANGRVTQLRLFTSGCAIDGAGQRVVWLGQPATGASLDLLEPLLDREGSGEGARDLAERALAAVAHHDDPRADRILEHRALDRARDSDDRQHALFWAGNLRGEAGYRLLDRVLSGEPDGEVREHALFALTQSSAAGAIERLKRAGIEDRDPEVRSQAMFWLAQSDAPGAGEWILGRMEAERDDEVREQAVFALSQLDDGAEWLLRLLRTSRDPEVVRQALFWLGQSEDPRALAELERIFAD